MTGTFGEMGNLLKQAQKMQRAIEEAEEELKRTTVLGTSGGGAVRIEVTGDWRVEKVEIADDALRGKDRSLLEDAVRGALRDALGKVAKLREERRRQITGGLDLPGFL
jgi:DNA-binding YbaB/EbfC family protein